MGSQLHVRGSEEDSLDSLGERQTCQRVSKYKLPFPRRVAIFIIGGSSVHEYVLLLQSIGDISSILPYC
jgi:hypothetical protein